MWIQETKRNYIFHRDCDRTASKKEKERYNIADGLRVTFIRGKKGKHRLCSMSFSKEWFDIEEAEAFWKDIGILLLDKKKSMNLKLPGLLFVDETADGKYIVGYYKGQPKKDTLKNQIENMELSEDDTVGRWYDNMLEALAESSGVEYSGDSAGKIPENYQVDTENHYIRSFMDVYKGTDKSIISALSQLSAMTMAEETSEGPVHFVEKYRKDLTGFFVFFMETLYTEAFEIKMKKNWLGELPRIIAIGAILKEEERKSFENAMFARAEALLDEKSKRNAEMLAGYILQGNEYLKTAVLVTDRFQAARIFTSKNIEEEKGSAHNLASALFAYGGHMIFRTFEDEDRYIVNGFCVKNGVPECIPAKKLKECTQRQPDGSLIEYPEDIYQVAFLHFEK